MCYFIPHSRRLNHPCFRGGGSVAGAAGIITFIRNFQAYAGSTVLPGDTGNQSFLFDGIDIDYEDTAALDTNSLTPSTLPYDGQNLLINLTTELRKAYEQFPASNNTSSEQQPI